MPYRSLTAGVPEQEGKGEMNDTERSVGVEIKRNQMDAFERYSR